MTWLGASPTYCSPRVQDFIRVHLYTKSCTVISDVSQIYSGVLLTLQIRLHLVLVQTLRDWYSVY